MVRPEFLHLGAAEGEYDNRVTGRLVNEYMLGSRYQYHVQIDDQVLTVERGSKFETSQDAEVTVAWSTHDSLVLEA